MNSHIILASKSPARKTLLESLGLSFEVIPSDFEEDMSLPLSPRELALHLSEGKAVSLAKRFPDSLIIAADTFVVDGSSLLGKPKDLEDAKRMLESLSGRSHQILTGLTVLQHDKKVQGVVETTVFFKDLSEEELDAYLKTQESLGKCGAYAIQGDGKALVEKVVGPIDNVSGLPLETLVSILNSHFDFTLQVP